MSLVEGDTLQARFGSLDESERQAICEEVRAMVNAWRALAQDDPDRYNGQRPLNDIFVNRRLKRSGPFVGEDAVRKFHDACGIDISGETPIAFTHNDLCPPNILLSPGRHPKVVAILDWGQSGWYPSYWEYCKGRRVGVVDEGFNNALQEEWHAKYLPTVVDVVDDEAYYHPWLYFMLSNI
ncbi:phosphotransferase enzyme family protein [Colletotrichum tofieldiae]|nr:phosphotransferase enzyme family protein [Colletotrichum tofieldiae]